MIRKGLQAFNLFFNADGTAINTAFPVASRQAKFIYDQNLAILAVHLSSTIRSESNLPSGVFLCLNQQGDTITTSQDSGTLAAHVSMHNTDSASTFYNPACQTTVITFDEASGIVLPANMPVSLYAATANSANNYITAVATLFCILIK